MAALAEARGHHVIVPDFRLALTEAPPIYFRIVQSVFDQLEAVSRTDDLALIVHSGAGALVPAIARRTSRIRYVTFVDSILPHPGKCWFDIAPSDLAKHLRALEKSGRLPRWHRWWPRGTIEALVGDGDPALLSAFIAELQEIPAAYLAEAAPLGDIPSALRCAYLQLGSAYNLEATEAERRGWPCKRLERHHLAMLTHAAEIEAALNSLIGACQLS